MNKRSRTTRPMTHNLIAAWLGQCIGDAYGSTYEFTAALKTVTTEPVALKGGGSFAWEPGEVTDDTQMATGIANMYIRAGAYNRAIHREEMLAWINSSPKDVGSWTRQSLRAWSTAPAFQANYGKREDHPVYGLWFAGGADNAGNGGPMKCVPSLLANPNKWSRISETIKICADTHPDPRCILSAVYTVEMANLLAQGVEPVRAHRETVMLLGKVADRYKLGGRQADILLDAIIPAYKAPWASWNNSGYVVPTMVVAIAAVCQATSFEEGLRMVISRGGDSDTVGAIAGVLLGARFGLGSDVNTTGIDPRLVRQIHDKRLPGMAERLLKVRDQRVRAPRG